MGLNGTRFATMENIKSNANYGRFQKLPVLPTMAEWKLPVLPTMAEWKE
jgi:hypothetical protein